MTRTTLSFLAGLLFATAAQAVDLIADPAFQLGFTVKDRDGNRQVVRWNEAATPVWKLAQHHSRSSLADTKHCTFHKNGLTFDDGYQTLIVHPESGEGDLIFGVNGYKEFGATYREQGDAWPHQLVAQRISGPRGHLQEVSPRLPDMERIDLAVRLRLLHDDPHKGPQFNPDLHGAQFNLYFTVQNLNRGSKDCGNYFWFGLTLYDSRYEVPSFFLMRDNSSPKKPGTGKLIYNIGIAPFTSDVVAAGKWVTVRGDLLPHVYAGLQEVWKRGDLGDSKDMADYGFGDTNLGWEVTGLNDAAMAVSGLTVAATLKTKHNPKL